MLCHKRINNSFKPVLFSIEDPQRTVSNQEKSRLAQCRQELSPLAYALFHYLVTLRTEQNRVIASKKYLLKYAQIGSYHTLDARLRELTDVGLIKTWKYFTKSATFARPKVHHCISFPCFRNSLPITANHDKPARGRELAVVATQESYGSKMNNYPDIPVTDKPCFPQVKVERLGEDLKPAVFLTTKPQGNERQPELAALKEDLSKSDDLVKVEIDDLVTTVKREKKHNQKVKTFADDVVCLKKDFGSRPVLTGLKCMMDSLTTIQNPGGWLRVHLKNPAWLNRFRSKFEELREVEQVRQEQHLATMARIAEDKKLAADNARLSEEVDRVLARLSVTEREGLWVEARAILTKNRGFITEGTVRATARTLARGRYLPQVPG